MSCILYNEVMTPRSCISYTIPAEIMTLGSYDTMIHVLNSNLYTKNNNSDNTEILKQAFISLMHITSGSTIYPAVILIQAAMIYL